MVWSLERWSVMKKKVAEAVSMLARSMRPIVILSAAFASF
jgi:hypothetical protein